MSDTYWIKSPTGELAVIDDAEQFAIWTRVHGWSETTEPGPADLVYMSRDDLPGPPAPIAWGARDYWQGIGFAPSAPPPPVNPAFDPILNDAAAAAPPDGKVDDVLGWVGGDRQRAEQALAAERDRDKPRATLVDALRRTGQPDDSAAPAAPTKEV